MSRIQFSCVDWKLAAISAVLSVIIEWEEIWVTIVASVFTLWSGKMYYLQSFISKKRTNQLYLK